jgi:hypothetical protein
VLSVDTGMADMLARKWLPDGGDPSRLERSLWRQPAKERLRTSVAMFDPAARPIELNSASTNSRKRWIGELEHMRSLVDFPELNWFGCKLQPLRQL